MNQISLKDVPKNMRQMGMLLFRNAFMEALHGEECMCVVHAAQAAEILLKARIAQENLLSIFSKLPRADSTNGTPTLIDLLENGRTLSYKDLPDRLWKTTGIKIDKITEYKDFGKLRNQIVHFSMANAYRVDELTLRYSLEVLDPLVESFWGKSVIDFITKDPNEPYASFVNSGLFEESISRVFTIDRRLRRLLGDASREALETQNAHFEETERFYRSKTTKDLEAEYETWAELQTDYDYVDEQCKQLLEDQVSWKIFLDSF